GWAILLRQKQKKLIMLPSETMIWQPEFTDKTLSRKPGAVQSRQIGIPSYQSLGTKLLLGSIVRALMKQVQKNIRVMVVTIINEKSGYC
ncbi:hypothetical protein, partial [Escherichia coli]|uniref:hypothetical protein n=1 Tax=Escherichia coli TaxID=562 RepID=UPI002033F0FD